ncbi:MAG: FlgT C-terminal domain-containing protein [Bacteroidota bacterium]
MRVIAKVLVLCLVCLNTHLLAQEGAVIKVVDSENVEINLGKSHDVQVGDKFTVYGKGKFLHPATGQMVDADNVAIGEIEITETMASTSMARIVTSNQTISINARLEKKASHETTQSIIFSLCWNIFHNYFGIDKCNWPENDSIFFSYGRKKRVDKNNIFLIQNNGEKGYLLVDFADKSKGNGRVFPIGNQSNKLTHDISKTSLLKYEPLLVKIGAGYTFNEATVAPSSGYKINVDWYPNKSIKEFNKYNDWLWVGTDINIDFFLLDELNNNTNFTEYIDYSSNSKMSLSFEVGFSPWRDNITGEKKFNFGISQKILNKVILYYYYDESNYTSEIERESLVAIKKNLPSIFLGYDFRRFSVSLVMGFAKIEDEVYDANNSIYNDSFSYTAFCFGATYCYKIHYLNRYINKIIGGLN